MPRVHFHDRPAVVAGALSATARRHLVPRPEAERLSGSCATGCSRYGAPLLAPRKETGGVAGAQMVLTTQWSEIERLKGRATTEAWQWFIDRYRGFVALALQRLIWSPERASAAVDEFWGNLFQSGVVERLHQPMRFRAFLVSTLRNYAHKWMRQNPQIGPGTSSERAAHGGGPLPEDEEVALWARQLLHLALARLERDQPSWARVLLSFYGLPPLPGAAAEPPRRATDIAAELQCSANALHQLLFRA